MNENLVNPQESAPRGRRVWSVVAHVLSWVAIATLTAIVAFSTLWSSGFGLSWPWWFTAGLFAVLLIITIGAFQRLRPRGHVGAFVSFLLVGVTLWVAATGVGGIVARGRGESVYEVNRVASSDLERQLISRAEAVPCPLEEGCIEGNDIDRIMSEGRERDKERLRTDATLRYDIRTELRYRAEVRRGFPGTFGWDDVGVTATQPEYALYWSTDGTVLSLEQCTALIPNEGYVVSLLLTDNTFCGPLCGSGSAFERRVYFDAEQQPTCQAIYGHGQWFS